MKSSYLGIIGGALILTIFQITACRDQSGNYHFIHPAHIEPVENSPFSKLELTEKAIERIDIKTAEVTEEMNESNDPNPVKTVPYSSLIYGPVGEVWVYANPAPKVFIRHEVRVDRIEGDKAVLMEGPPGGTKIVSQGAAELYGTEYEVGH
jgi:hypothetical protein